MSPDNENNEQYYEEDYDPYKDPDSPFYDPYADPDSPMYDPYLDPDAPWLDPEFEDPNNGSESEEPEEEKQWEKGSCSQHKQGDICIECCDWFDNQGNSDVKCEEVNCLGYV